MNSPYRLILASKSPRRQQLIAALGLPFDLRVLEVDESFSTDLPANEVAKYLARKKAHAYTLANQEVLITADTIVTIDNTVLGKPRDEKEAFEMLSMLSGRSHEVITGVCIRNLESLTVFDCTTKVIFNKMTKGDISKYIEEFKPFDKAGSYGIQECKSTLTNLCSMNEKDFMTKIGQPRLYESVIDATEKASTLDISHIEGSFFNVVGFPIDLVYNKLSQLEFI